jgi:glycosyltransferase involved in cell wall biosynthesis
MKIRAIPAQPHCFAFGGFDIQMHRTLEVLQALGVDAKPLDFWSRDADFDILHFWGFETSHLLAARFAVNYGKKIVLTPLFPYVTAKTRLRNIAARIEGRARPRLELAALVDRFLVVNEQQGETAQRFFRVPSRKIEIIPTMVDDRFFAGGDSNKAFADDFRDFFLCAGNVCARKNQLRLAQAAIATKQPILFAGDLAGGEEAYGEDFARLIAPYSFLRWNRWMPWGNLLEAYQACVGVVLPSFDEQQPTTGLEAAAIGKPLMLGRRPYARQKFYQNAKLVEPASVDHIGRGLREMRADPAQYVPPRAFVEECRIDRVGLKLKRIFESLV